MAHPRSRGENLSDLFIDAAAQGSSPLTRGKRRRPRRRDRRHGLIPAHAGKTAWTCARSASFRAHPRSRGENPRRAPVSSSIAGSSPLTRGKQGVAVGAARIKRLIPAHAGKTAAGRRGQADQRAHPRSRGENDAYTQEAPPPAGSSPLTRGKHHADRRADRAGGLIPAHAGKTACSTRLMHSTRAHPRSRGENEHF